LAFILVAIINTKVLGEDLAFAALFGGAQLVLHLKEKELRWFQIKDNYGEVFFAFSASITTLLILGFLGFKTYFAIIAGY